jgi:hypothetical protein
MKKEIGYAAMALACLAGPAASQSAPNCLPRAQLVEKLSVRFDEQLMGRGMQNQIRLLEIFASTDGASWTILQTHANGTSCVVASGTNWMDSKMKVLPGVPG